VTQPEYVAALLSIIVGLGVTDLAQSVRELVRPRRTVNWHWLPLLWAATTFLMAIQLWWNSFSFLTGAISQFFLPFLVSFLFLYLTCAFALPDPEWERPEAEPEDDDSSPSSPLDLKAFYFSDAHRRWFFGVFIALLVTGQIGTQTARALGEYGAVNPQEVVGNATLVGLIGTLIPTNRWWVHAPVSVVCFAVVAGSTLRSIFL
jgi:hypothetical protein